MQSSCECETPLGASDCAGATNEHSRVVDGQRALGSLRHEVPAWPPVPFLRTARGDGWGVRQPRGLGHNNKSKEHKSQNIMNSSKSQSKQEQGHRARLTTTTYLKLLLKELRVVCVDEGCVDAHLRHGVLKVIPECGRCGSGRLSACTGDDGKGEDQPDGIHPSQTGNPEEGPALPQTRREAQQQ